MTQPGMDQLIISSVLQNSSMRMATKMKRIWTMMMMMMTSVLVGRDMRGWSRKGGWAR